MKKKFVAVIAVLSLLGSITAYALNWPSGLTTRPTITMTVPSGQSNYEPSGVVWNPETNKLFLVCNTGRVSMMDMDGSNQNTRKMTSYMDFEAVTVADPNSSKVYLGLENPDKILEFDWTPSATQDPNTPGTEVLGLTGKEWDLRAFMYGADNSGLEGLAYVPNGYHPYPDSDFGGLFYAALQRAPVTTDSDPKNDFLIYAVDLNRSGGINNWYGIPVASGTPTSDISDMYFSTDTGVLYVLYDGANRLIEMAPDGTVLRNSSNALLDYTGVPVADQEGVTVVTSSPSTTADIYLASDSTTTVGWYSGYPVSYDADRDGTPNSSDGCMYNKNLTSKVTYYQDTDGDGLGSDVSLLSCSSTAPAGYVTNSDDRDDSNPNNVFDEDSDGFTSDVDCNDLDANGTVLKTYYRDEDGDGLGFLYNQTDPLCTNIAPPGFVDNSLDVNDRDYDNDGVLMSEDCDDHNREISAKVTYYLDNDLDGLGSDTTTLACPGTAGTNYVTNSDDLNDNDHDNDNLSATDDCDDDNANILGRNTYYEDKDDDSLGSSIVSFMNPLLSCDATPPSNYVTNDDDLNDKDHDNDGVITGEDCNDDDALLKALITYYSDFDSDGHGYAGKTTEACSLTSPNPDYVADSTDPFEFDYDNDGTETNLDCNDHDAALKNWLTVYPDNDLDGLGAKDGTTICAASVPAGYVTNSNDLNDNDFDNDGMITSKDCNDHDATVSFTTTYYQDSDEDGLGSDVSLTVCSTTAPSKYVTNSDDLNDKDYDNDGISTWRDCNDKNPLYFYRYFYYKDADGDGYGNKKKWTYACVPPTGYVRDSTDKNDGDPNVH